MPSNARSKSKFVERLNEACDLVGLEPLHKGRQVTLSKKLGVSQQAVRKWFSGESRPSFERISELADVLGTSVAFLMGETSERPEPSDETHKATNDRMALRALQILTNHFPDEDIDELFDIAKKLAVGMSRIG